MQKSYSKSKQHTAVLHTSKESRAESLRYYLLVEQPTYQSHSLGVLTPSVATYINFAVDRFVYGNIYRHMGEIDEFFFSSSILAKIQILEYQSYCRWTWGSFDGLPTELLCATNKLKEVKFIERFDTPARVVSEKYIETDGSAGACLLLKARKEYMTHFLDSVRQDQSRVPDHLQGVAVYCEIIQEEGDLDYPAADGIDRRDREPRAHYDRDCIRINTIRVTWAQVINGGTGSAFCSRACRSVSSGVILQRKSGFLRDNDIPGKDSSSPGQIREVENKY